MYELIYAGKEVENIIRAEYPKAKITDASDFIHEERFECCLEVEEVEFYVFAIRQGFAECCIGFNLMMRNHPEGSLQKIWDWVAEAIALEESDNGQ